MVKEKKLTDRQCLLSSLLLLLSALLLALSCLVTQGWEFQLREFFEMLGYNKLIGVQGVWGSCSINQLSHSKFLSILTTWQFFWLWSDIDWTVHDYHLTSLDKSFLLSITCSYYHSFGDTVRIYVYLLSMSVLEQDTVCNQVPGIGVLGTPPTLFDIHTTFLFNLFFNLNPWFSPTSCPKFEPAEPFSGPGGCLKTCGMSCFLTCKF